MIKQTDTELSLRVFGAWATLILFGLGLVLIALEFNFHRHGETSLEDMPLFPAVFGFLVFVVIVFGGVILRKLIMREEDYYGDH